MDGKTVQKRVNMKDGYGRTIDYLRLSVTDRCNLRCKYCMPDKGVESIPHEEILRFEEIIRLCRIFAELGIKKLRLTGGEPLVRKGVVSLLESLSEIDGIKEIYMTTNGVLLKDNAAGLSAAGLKGVNVSLDCIDRGIYEKITGADAAEKVLEGIDAALEEGLKVKINCVPVRGYNADMRADAGESSLTYLRDMALLAKDRPLDMRFIELMPLGRGRFYEGIDTGRIMSFLVESFGTAKKISEEKGNGPAVCYAFEGFKGKIGFISPVSGRFCEKCNRLRLTPEGYLKLCLYHKDGVDLRKILRCGNSDETIKNAIEEAVNKKPAAHAFFLTESGEEREMNGIGG